MKKATYRDTTFFYYDQLEFDTLIEEEFKQHQYYVDLPTNEPFIIDVGAHIGTSTLYLHTVYPNATFVCVEPHPQNIQLLAKNLEANGITRAAIIPKALVGKRDKRETVELFSNNTFTVFSSLKRGGWSGKEDGQATRVKTAKLSEIIKEIVAKRHNVEYAIDLLKIDIEGAETDVIDEAQQELKHVRHVIIEFHKTYSHHEKDLLKILRQFFAFVEITHEDKKAPKHQRLLLIEARKK